MAIRWLIRVVLQVTCGVIFIAIFRRWLPSSSQPTDYVALGVILTCFGAAFALADLAWPLLNRKLDEQLSAISPLSTTQRHRWRIDAYNLERDYFFIFLSAIALKAFVLAVGALLLNKVIPNNYCGQAARVGIFLAGCAIPTLIFMSNAYFSVRRAKIELTRYEEEEAERRKVLESLRSTVPYDFDGDPHFAGYTKVVQPEA